MLVNHGSIETTQIDIQQLPRVPFERRDRLPIDPCVYFVLDPDDTVLYIGQGKNLHRRWMNHEKVALYRHLSGIRIAWLVVSQVGLLPQIEAICIRSFSPRDNSRDFSSCTAPYRLQIFLPDELRMGLRDAAHEEYVSMQKLVEGILADYLTARKQRRKKEHEPEAIARR